jgi:hypothetical protein
MSNAEKKRNGNFRKFGSDKMPILDPIVTPGLFECYAMVTEPHNSRQIIACINFEENVKFMSLIYEFTPIMRSRAV